MDSNNQVNVRSKRLASLDALRGFDMFLIIGGEKIVTTLAEQTNCEYLKSLMPTFSTHVMWEGFNFRDLIQPLFLFIVGIAMPYSFGKRLSGGESKRSLYYHTIKRVVILLILGLMMQGHLLDYSLETFRLHTNTLTTIAAGYLFASIIILHLKTSGQIVTTVILMLVYWAFMMLVPVPGYGAGVLTAEGNLAGYIDNFIFGGFADVSHTLILSSMAMTCTVMLGALAGQLLRSDAREKTKVLSLIAVGVGCIVLAIIWNNWFPIIKKLWTSSFLLYAGGWSFLLLAVFYLLIDVLGYRKWSFGFVVIGMNAIAVYSATSLFDFRKIGDIFVQGLEHHIGRWYPFSQALAAFIVVWLILYWMYRKKTFIKI